MLAIVDAGPLYASLDVREAAHRQSVTVLGRLDLTLVIPALVLAEAAYLAGERLGARVEAAFLRGIAALDAVIEAPTPADLRRMAELVERYGDFPLGATDASIVALAERLGTDLIVTLDRRHFSAVKPRHCPAFHLLPE